MASYHAKLYPVDKTGISSYQFRIGDCYQVATLRGPLTTEEEYNNAINKLENLELSAKKFKDHLKNQKFNIYGSDTLIDSDNEMDKAILDDKDPINFICYGQFIDGEWECKHCIISAGCANKTNNL